MKIEDHRYQRDRQHQTSGDAPSELIPDRIERDLLAKPLVLGIAAVEIIRDDRHKGANHQLKHGRPPPSLQCLAEAPPGPSWACPLPNPYTAWRLRCFQPTLRCR